MLHVLLVEGNARTGRDRHAAAYGCTPAESYAAALGTLAADLAITIVCNLITALGNKWLPILDASVPIPTKAKHKY